MDLTLILSFLFVCIAAIIIGMKICFASKCQNVELCWGLLQISRMVNMESTEFHSNSNQENQTIQRQNDSNKKQVGHEHSLNAAERIFDQI